VFVSSDRHHLESVTPSSGTPDHHPWNAQSTLADQVGGCTAVLMPLFKRLEAYVLGAVRLHGDDTTVPVLAKGKSDSGRIWV
jgi:transposase